MNERMDYWMDSQSSMDQSMDVSEGCAPVPEGPVWCLNYELLNRPQLIDVQVRARIACARRIHDQNLDPRGRSVRRTITQNRIHTVHNEHQNLIRTHHRSSRSPKAQRGHFTERKPESRGRGITEPGHVHGTRALSELVSTSWCKYACWIVCSMSLCELEGLLGS